jgi:hypothetical protein
VAAQDGKRAHKEGRGTKWRERERKAPAADSAQERDLPQGTEAPETGGVAQNGEQRGKHLQQTPGFKDPHGTAAEGNGRRRRMAKACKTKVNKGARKRLGREGMRAGEGAGDGERVRARNGEDAGEGAGEKDGRPTRAKEERQRRKGNARKTIKEQRKKGNSLEGEETTSSKLLHSQRTETRKSAICPKALKLQKREAQTPNRAQNSDRRGKHLHQTPGFKHPQGTAAEGNWWQRRMAKPRKGARTRAQETEKRGTDLKSES